MDGTEFEAARAVKIVDHAVPEAEVLGKATEIASALASKAKPALRVLKTGMYPRALEALALEMSSVPSS